MILIEKKSKISGDLIVREIPMETREYYDANHKWEYSNLSCEKCFPDLSKADIAFLKDGFTVEEWKKYFSFPFPFETE